MNNMKELRKRAGFPTQAEVAAIANISVPTLSNYESGKTFPTYKTLKVLADLYGKSVDDFHFSTDECSVKPENEV